MGPSSQRTGQLCFCDLEIHTDGSAILGRGWPAIPLAAGWGALFCGILADGSKRLMGAMWGPVTAESSSLYFLGAKRPTIPVAEASAITVALRLLRQSSFSGNLIWGTDSLYALGIMLHGNGAMAEIALVSGARAEMGVYWIHFQSHIGFLPNACADVLALMGRFGMCNPCSHSGKCSKEAQ